MNIKERIEMKINVGAGDTRYEGYVNCDYDTKFNPEYVFDIEKENWPFDDNSVSSIIIHHVLEHMGEGYFHVLQEMYRVCKPSTIIDIRVPHYNHHCFFHDPTHRRPITPYGLMLFSKEHNDKDTGASSKLGYFFNVDFKVLSEQHILDTNHPRINELLKMSKKQLEDFAFETNNVFYETRIELMVVKGDREEQIKGFYLNLLNREADENGLNNYLNSDLSMTEIKNGILNSEEYKRKFNNG